MPFGKLVNPVKLRWRTKNQTATMAFAVRSRNLARRLIGQVFVRQEHKAEMLVVGPVKAVPCTSIFGWAQHLHEELAGRRQSGTWPGPGAGTCTAPPCGLTQVTPGWR